MSELILEGIYKDFPTHRVVDGITLTVPQGCFYSLLGPSGCGKTTTLRMIAGFDEPDRGLIKLNGRTLNGLRPYERPVTTVFQSYALFPHLTAAENVAFGLQRRKDPDMARKVRDALELVQLSAKADRLPAKMSGGERQRTALARALVLEPELLLLDEPLSALDPALRKQMRVELKELQARVGITFLFITHDQEEALSLSDRIAVMRQGRIGLSPGDLSHSGDPLCGELSGGRQLGRRCGRAPGVDAGFPGTAADRDAGKREHGEFGDVSGWLLSRGGADGGRGELGGPDCSRFGAV